MGETGNEYEMIQMERTISTDSGRQSRRHDNDWLVVLATLVIFLFHCARFFNFEDWHVKNNQLDGTITLLVTFVAQWVMPLFFVLSGFSSSYSLKSRAGSRYLGNRFRRLVIPFVFGTFILLVPVQVWIERVSHAQFNGSFIEFYPRYFEGFYAFGGNFAWMGLHLWYLEILFIFTLLTYPLFILLKNERIRGAISHAADHFSWNGAIFLFAIPLFLMELMVNQHPHGVGMRAFGGWSLFSYLVFFVNGFLLSFDSRYSAAMEKMRYVSLVLGMSTAGLMFLAHIDLAPFGHKVTYGVTILFRSFNAWFWLVAIFGFGSKYLTMDHKILKHAREAAFPFYILHQTIIVVTGFYIRNWEIGIMVKYLFLAAFSFVTIMVLYWFLIKRVRMLRFIFGMET